MVRCRKRRMMAMRSRSRRRIMIMEKLQKWFSTTLPANILIRRMEGMRSKIGK